MGARDFAGDLRRVARACWRGSTAAAGGEQFLVDLQWISSPDIHFAISVNGVSLWLVLLSTLLTPLCVLISWNYIQKRVKEFYAFLLLLEFGLIGVFLAQDLFLFYVFWEISPGPHVLPDRHLGPRPPHLRRGEVLPVHHGRLGADAGGDHLHLQRDADVQLPDACSTCSPAAG